MQMKFALAGNPNSGKTTLFNALTGSSQYVGNWPGVTVEKKEGKLKGAKDVIITDLPGVYSLSPYTLEEVVSRKYILQEHPAVIINIVDASNLERNLYLTTQLLELGIPMVIALTKVDVVERRHHHHHHHHHQHQHQHHQGHSGERKHQHHGEFAEQRVATELSHRLHVPVIPINVAKGIGISELIQRAIEVSNASMQALAKIKPMQFEARTEEAIAAAKEIAEKYAREHQINARWLAIKLLEKDKLIGEQIHLSPNEDAYVAACALGVEKQLDNEFEDIITNERYRYIDSVTRAMTRRSRAATLTRSDKIDRIVTSRILALPIFFVVMWLIYFIAISLVGSWTTDALDAFISDVIGGNLRIFLESIGTHQVLIALIIDGIVSGVGAVLTFIPQLVILFFCLSFLEDCGYMSRVAFIMDRIFRRFGLSGKSFIPMIIGTGCSVPGIMVTRTIENESDRRMTIMLTPFIPCGAKLPVFALFIAAFFPAQTWIGPSMYLVGIVMVVLCGTILKRTMFKGEPAPFVMELPEYKFPQMKSVLTQTWDRSRSFLIKAGTVIFVASGLIWFMQNFSFSLQMVAPSHSMMHDIGSVLAPIFAPLGFGNWQSAFATITGLVAKENIVATFGVLYGASDTDAAQIALAGNFKDAFTPVSAYAFMIFTLLASPCVAAISAIKREMHSWKWTFITIGFQTGVAYIVALLVYQIGSLIVGA